MPFIIKDTLWQLHPQFCLHPIGQNFSSWPHLTARKTMKRRFLSQEVKQNKRQNNSNPKAQSLSRKEEWSLENMGVTYTALSLKVNPALISPVPAKDYKLGRGDPQEKDLASNFLRSLGDLKAKSGYKWTFKSMNEGIFYLALSSPAFIECLCVCVQLLSYSQLFTTPWTTACQAPLSMEFSRQEYWSGLPFPTPRYLPNTENKPMSLESSALAGRFFASAPPGKPRIFMVLLSSC